MHFPVDRDINYYAQLTSERRELKIQSGKKFWVWTLPGGRANEALDCRVYAYGALCGLLYYGLQLNKRAMSAQIWNGPAAPAMPGAAAPVTGTQQKPSPMQSLVHSLA